MDKEYISRIVKKIAEEKCLVILGPELLYENGESTNSKLGKELHSTHGDQVKYYPDDEMFKFDNSLPIVVIEDDIQDFYNQLEPNELYKKIADIPFATIINTAPDKTLNKAFEAKNIPFDYDYYRKGEAQKEYERTNKTLIYNIFGDYSDINSLILTFDDLFDYLFSIMGDFELNIKSELRRATSVLFIGFDFDKWYFKLLLRLIKINENKLLHSHDIHQENSKNFYSEEFKVTFFGSNSAEEIIIEIHNQALEKGLIIAKPEIFVSYAWGGESEEIVDKLDTVLQNNNLKLTRDKRDLAYQERISFFMDQIGKGKGIVVVISEKYLKSPYCMYELLEIYQNKDFESRIIPIVLSDSKIYETDSLLAYQEFWIEEKNKLDQKIKENGGDAIAVIGEEYKLFKRVVDNWGDLMTILKDINSLSTEEHLKSEFAGIIKTLKEKVQPN
ncbi:toll/interleukin-1 receptor domain-containing protein [Algoriphagus lutimaris]|uniref:toll/interleukin-1 receptor domain-containing protein n=1 Tax=Algoriphagus lutimaris TaxID=613197 RepID=UPI00196AF071|nr:toll/interleukin-1 receptor domain-containing protein [Algoriphagus lutimaris]MBN3522060.1 toll/interleukin-1 receptor domain-containing protein [Algoriphagus lutimaris]